MDVISLYTNNEKQIGITACKYFLGKHSIQYEKHNQMLIQMIENCLTKNLFLFGEEIYIQTKGTAMGFSFSPSYACLTMGWWEQHLAWHPDHDEYVNKTVSWFRFIDDLFIICDGTELGFQKYFEILNNTEANIRFTYEISRERVTFLDTEMYVKSGKIHTTLHRKKTATNAVLHAQSFHQNSLIQNIPYGEFLRIKRICSEKEEWHKHRDQTTQRFRCRGYKEETITGCCNRAESKSRDEIIKEKLSVTETNIIRLFTTLSKNQSK